MINQAEQVEYQSENKQDPLRETGSFAPYSKQLSSRREQFFNLLNGKKNNRPVIFFPDITDWYVSGKTPAGQALPLGGGAFISDSHPINKIAGKIPAQYKDFTFLDFYRKFGWGLPVHIYDWYDVKYQRPDIKKEVRQSGKERRTFFHTAQGTLTRTELLSNSGTWAPHEFPVKSPADLKIMAYITESENYIPRYEKIEQILKELGSLGVADLVIRRSPFGKLVHEFMGFEQVIYNLFDNERDMLHFLALQEKKDMEVIELAAKAPAKIVIVGDHADENLISPDYYRDFCMPFYKKISTVLHNAGKYISTHLDGNFKGYFPLLPQAGFDLLDGCTPAPMFNYEVEELAKILPGRMYCYCGVPATLFTQKLPDTAITDFGKRIVKAFNGRVILNIGDILPPNGDIEQVIRLGEL
ncbi:MAG: uroporphyrinogen decarboxylase family protein [Victivallaceae bacterium]|nr:uroporphyrinogen decarboxylase family protein [Victivallaceae bacterium]